MKVEGKVLPLHIAMRGMLDSRTLSDMIRATTCMNLSCCAHYMIASSKGEGVSLEAQFRERRCVFRIELAR